MPWTESDYPDSWKNVSADTRDKAIEIGNALVRRGMDEGIAIPIALSQARITIDEDDAGPVDQWVVPHPRGWAVRAEHSVRVTEVFEKKAAAIKRAEEIARNQGTSVTIQDEQGQIEARRTPND